MLGMNALLMMQLRRKLGQTYDPIEEESIPNPEAPFKNDTTDARNLRALFSDPESVNLYRQHVKSFPERQDPSRGDKVLAGLSSIMDDRPHDRFERVKSVLNRDYEDKVQDWGDKGTALGKVAALDERSQGKELDYQRHVEAIGERRRASEEALNMQHNRLELDRQRYERDATNERLTAQERASAQKRHDEVLLEIARMRNANRPENESGWSIDVDEKGKKVRINARTGEVRSLEKDIYKYDKDSDVGKNTLNNAKSLLTDLDNLEKLTKNAPWHTTGGVMGPLSNIVSKRMSGVGGDDMRSIAERIKADYLTATGGKSLTKSEIALLQPFIPDPTNQPKDRYEANLRQFRERLSRIIAAREQGKEVGSEGKRTITLKSGKVIEVE